MREVTHQSFKFELAQKYHKSSVDKFVDSYLVNVGDVLVGDKRVALVFGEKDEEDWG